MTDTDFISSLAAAISIERFSSYYSTSSQNEYEALGNYAWNIALCESLYPALNSIEVALCNGINDAATAYYGDDSWFHGTLKEQENKRLQLLSSRFRRLGLTSPTVGDIIAGLSLGFWVDLLKGRYEQILWPALLPVVFPYATNKQRSRERIYQRLAKIQVLRNRVFHHEPVWHLSDLEQRHQEIPETIGWISPAMLEMTLLLDRIDSVYTRGEQPLAEELDSIAQNWNA